MGGLQPWHIILIVVAALLLFGGKKLPEAARGLGRSLRIFKSEVSAMSEDKKSTEPVADSAVATPAAQIAATPVVVTPTPAAAPAAVPVTPVPVATNHTPVDTQAG